MRIAIVHDWLVASGGAEKVTRELVRAFPEADLFALIDHLSDTDRAELLQGRRARTTFIQHLPFARTHYRWYLPLFPRAIQRLDLSAYDLILSASYAVAKGVRKRPGAVHVCYIHTPMRYAWVDEAGYLADHGMHGLKRWFVRKQLARLRRWDRSTNAGVDRFVANSANVARRVWRWYGREAEVLLPPVDDAVFRPGNATAQRTHFLAAARLVPYKRMDRIIEAFRRMPEVELLVCGDGPERERLAKDLPPNVRLLGHVPQTELVRLMRSAYALVCAADEDLGLTPMEAQACGTPVVALRRGGYLETITEGESGIFFAEATPEAIQAAVLRLWQRGVRASPAQLHARMAPYFAAPFRARMHAVVQAACSQRR